MNKLLVAFCSLVLVATVGCSRDTGLGLDDQSPELPRLTKPSGKDNGDGQPLVVGGGKLEHGQRVTPDGIITDSGHFNIVARPQAGNKDEIGAPNAVVTWQYGGDAGEVRQVAVPAFVSGDPVKVVVRFDIRKKGARRGPSKLGNEIVISKGKLGRTIVRIRSGKFRVGGELTGNININLKGRSL